ncbi:lipopolysaccharide biosynthesis protein [Pseudonocardia sp. HH130630-07]|uniref:lipopolysaccharide biosynthesis protein n=1 Tax=Pseudonocardia sp. HH130630-07 TaxID=1690815 RepID=UPI0018D2E95E|nr:lipopolysaccharide biosynthesis protein [Pseudonocardia sp. HH130630-07]
MAPDASRAVLGRGSLYTLGSVAPILANVLVTPVVTRVLGLEQYGIVAAGLILVQVGAMVVGLGLGSSITRHGILERSGADGARALVLQGSAISTGLVVAALLAGPLWSEPVLSVRWQAGLAFAALSAAGFAAVLNAQAFLRVQDRPLPFVVMSGVATLGGPLAGLGMALWRSADADDYLFGLLLGYLAAGLTGVVLAWRGGRPRTERGDLWRALKVGLPAVPHLVALLLVQNALVVIVNHVFSPADGGRMQVALLLGSAPAMVVSALNNAWAPVIYRTDPAQRGEALEHSARDVAAITVALSGGVALLAPFLLRVLAPAEFSPAELVPVTAVATIGAVVSVAYLANVHLVFASGRSAGLALASPVSLVIGLVAAILLARTGSLTAVAVGFPLIYVALAVGTSLLRRRVSETRWRESVLALPVLAGALVCGAAVVLPAEGIGWLSVRFGLAVLLGVALLWMVRRIFTRS